jgi:hypothetical protein
MTDHDLNSVLIPLIVVLGLTILGVLLAVFLGIVFM